MTPSLDLDALEAKARAATAGEWQLWTSNSWRRIGSEHNYESVTVLTPTVHPRDGWPDISDPTGGSNLDYVIAAQPCVVLALIERLRAAERDAAMWRELDEIASNPDYGTWAPLKEALQGAIAERKESQDACR